MVAKKKKHNLVELPNFSLSVGRGVAFSCRLETPLFSIVCTTFNRPKLLLRAVNSVLRQHFEDFELIIVNDGSTNDTSSVAKTFHDSRIVYLEHTKNKGLNAARNTGIMKAKGKLLAFLDDDDELSTRSFSINTMAGDCVPNIYYVLEWI